MGITNYIQEKWKNNLLPGTSCLMHANGNVLVFNSYYVAEKRQYYCFPLCDTTITSLEKYTEDIWTEMTVYDEICIDYNNGYIYPGEGSMGNEGIVCHVDKHNNLIWAFFFDFSNPLEKLEIKENILYCYSNNDHLVKINMQDMSSVEVINTFQYGAGRK